TRLLIPPLLRAWIRRHRPRGSRRRYESPLPETRQRPDGLSLRRVARWSGRLLGRRAGRRDPAVRGRRPPGRYRAQEMALRRRFGALTSPSELTRSTAAAAPWKIWLRGDWLRAGWLRG